VRSVGGATVRLDPGRIIRQDFPQAFGIEINCRPLVASDGFCRRIDVRGRHRMPPFLTAKPIDPG